MKLTPPTAAGDAHRSATIVHIETDDTGRSRLTSAFRDAGLLERTAIVRGPDEAIRQFQLDAGFSGLDAWRPCFISIDAAAPDECIRLIRALRADARTSRIPIIVLLPSNLAIVDACYIEGANSCLSAVGDGMDLAERIRRMAEYWLERNVFYREM